MIKPLNTLRFVFMMMIFLHHIDLYPGGGSLAVSAFFILSGFCLSLGYGEKTIQEDFDYIGYLKKRLAKFYPIHWIYLAVFVVLGLLLNPCFQIPLRPLSANVLLMQSWVPEQDYYFSFNAVSWYLCDAVFLAFIFPLLFPAINKLFNQQKWMLLGLMLALYVLMVVFIPGGPLRKSLLYINPLGRCFDFVLGILIYHLLMFLKQKPLRINNRGGYLYDSLIILSLIIAVGVSFINKRHTIAIGYWLPIAIMVLCVALNDAYHTNSLLDRIMRHPISQWLSQCAMSFFLVHFIVVSYWREIYCYNLEAFIVSFVMAQVSYYLIEKKLTGWIQKRI